MDKKAFDTLKQIEAQARELEAQGIRIKVFKPTTTVKKTFEVETAQLNAFLKVVGKRDVKVKVAVAEMFELWLKKYNR